eukprot:scaffold120613_cov33-Tisochrysis_lutea.AAC.2
MGGAEVWATMSRLLRLTVWQLSHEVSHHDYRGGSRQPILPLLLLRGTLASADCVQGRVVVVPHAKRFVGAQNCSVVAEFGSNISDPMTQHARQSVPSAPPLQGLHRVVRLGSPQFCSSLEGPQRHRAR